MISIIQLKPKSTQLKFPATGPTLAQTCKDLYPKWPESKPNPNSNALTICLQSKVVQCGKHFRELAQYRQKTTQCNSKNLMTQYWKDQEKSEINNIWLNPKQLNLPNSYGQSYTTHVSVMFSFIHHSKFLHLTIPTSSRVFQKKI